MTIGLSVHRIAASEPDRVRSLAAHEHPAADEMRLLLGDLHAARRRAAEAANAERRRIERDLHDGAQQRLIAIRVELGLLVERCGPEAGGLHGELEALRGQLDEALDELRELARGLYPPLLASDGLHAALSMTARRSPIPVSVRASRLPRAPRSVESTAYFACVEALQNVAKHAGPDASARVDLAMRDGVLEFSVTDDGAGFDPATVRPGYGLVNLHDRLDALGGQCTVRSAPGRGTTVRGRIPVP